MDLLPLTVAELRKLIVDATAELKKKTVAETDEARAKIHAIAKEQGVSVEELMGLNSKTKKTTKKVVARYRNPANSNEEWTGRGRTPTWAQPFKEAGTLDTTLIASSSGGTA